MILRSTDTWNAINSTLQIWIAAGTYVPTEPLLPGDEQSASFVLKGNQVVVYGGFRGQVFDDLGALVYEGENSLEEREYGNVYSGDRQEPWALKNQTILSGDRLRNDVVGTDNMFSSLDPTQNTTRTDNLHTVVTFDPSSVDVMLDGITIVGALPMETVIRGAAEVYRSTVSVAAYSDACSILILPRKEEPFICIRIAVRLPTVFCL